MGSPNSHGAVSTWLLGGSQVHGFNGGRFGPHDYIGLKSCTSSYSWNTNCLTLYIIPVGEQGLQQMFSSYILGETDNIPHPPEPNGRYLIQENSKYVRRIVEQAHANKICDEITILGNVAHIKINFGWEQWGPIPPDQEQQLGFIINSKTQEGGGRKKIKKRQSRR